MRRPSRVAHFSSTLYNESLHSARQLLNSRRPAAIAFAATHFANAACASKMASSGRAAGSAGAGLNAGLPRDDDGRMSACNGYATLRGGDCEPSASSSSDDSSSGDDDGTSSGDSSSSSGSSSDSGSSDVAQAGASQSEDIDIEEAPTVSIVAAGAAFAAGEPQMGIWIQPNVVRPADLPSDHPDEVHDWSGWPKFPAKKDSDQQPAIAPSLPAKVPHVALVNQHEFLLPRMELLIHTQGRFMQPAPSFRITNLVDDLQYTAWLTFTDSTGSECVGQYSHPDSPHPGSSWNGRVLSFSRLKLFSSDGFTSKPPPITLTCNNSYRIQVNVGIVEDSGHILSASVVRQFVGAYFVAVTQYSKKPSLSRPSNKGLKTKAR
ncbi:optomotor-blind protein-like isoform X2 [Dermacentor albipictus]|uniref:optomotor-blind protein-like isoform X3 n=1 Tax=Dermacentor albipictus TaxID=60249 RepID=UPI0038FC54F9